MSHFLFLAVVKTPVSCSRFCICSCSCRVVVVETGVVVPEAVVVTVDAVTPVFCWGCNQ